MRTRRHSKHLAMFHLFVLSVLMLQLTGVSVAQKAAQPMQDQPAPAAPGSLVDVNGFKVHIDCTSRGRPSIVLIHGLGDYSFDWALVQSRVASHVEACAYDRAAAAWSDPGLPPRGLNTSAHELHLLLKRLHVQAPYILVGHSWGGLIARMYAHEFPKGVAGIVLVDSADEDEYLWINGKVIRPRFLSDAEWTNLTKPQVPPSPPPTSVSARPPEAPRRPKMTSVPSPFDKLPPDAQKLQLWAMSQPFTKERQEGGDTQDMRRDFIAMHDVRRQSKHSLGNIPLIVLSKTPGVDDDDDYTSDQLKWNRELQDQLAALSTNSEHLVADRSGHHIQLDQPELVIASILRVIDAVRHHRPLKDEPALAR
jgi:pimeloyl-ACP methyl ester carboxylesterase